MRVRQLQIEGPCALASGSRETVGHPVVGAAAVRVEQDWQQGGGL